MQRNKKMPAIIIHRYSCNNEQEKGYQKPRKGINVLSVAINSCMDFFFFTMPLIPPVGGMLEKLCF